MASSKSLMSTASFPWRAACHAASLTRFASSAPAQPGARRATVERLPQRIQLVDEDDARSFLLGLGEEVADSRGPHPDEHLHEVGAAQAEEGDAGLAGHGLGQQRLARTRRSDDEHPFGNLPAEA